MKKISGICVAILMTVFILAGCSVAGEPAAGSTAGTQITSNTDSTPARKVVVNFEGVVTDADGDEVTLESGKIIVISTDTVFAGDPDTGNAVDEEITVGNFIQGYTSDDPDGDRVSADKIYSNLAASK